MNKTIQFKDLNISKELFNATKDMGFVTMTPIQSEAIPEILTGCDITGLAATGTGKTAAFAIPAIEQIDEKNTDVQVAVLCPTRELAMQVAHEINKLLKYKKKLLALAVYGGQPIHRQISALRKKPQIIVGTPGRMIDHMERGTVRISNANMIVLDEADEMLNMGFRKDIERILEVTKKGRQTILFSATMSPDILRLTKRYQKKPKIIKVAKAEQDVSKIKQSYFDVEPRKKTNVLMSLIDTYNPKLSIVFCNTKRKVDQVSKTLRAKGFAASGIHGDIRQTKRDSIMSRFRKGRVSILVATDVAARGIDVDDVEIVFNYEVPKDVESYVHRIGRTGRAGKKGKALSFVSRREFGNLRGIMRYTKTDIKKQWVPSLGEIKEITAQREQDKLEAQAEQIFGKVKQYMKNDDLAQYSQMMKRFLGQNKKHTKKSFYSSDVAAALLRILMEKKQVMICGGKSE
jgi:ATP-dependent RNA helicase DeaD